MPSTTKEQARDTALSIKKTYQEFEGTLQKLMMEQNSIIDSFLSTLQKKRIDDIKSQLLH